MFVRHERPNEIGDLISRGVQGEVSCIQDLSFRNVAAVRLGFRQLKRWVVLAPKHQQSRFPHKFTAFERSFEGSYDSLLLKGPLFRNPKQNQMPKSPIRFFVVQPSRLPIAGSPYHKVLGVIVARLPDVGFRLTS